MPTDRLTNVHWNVLCVNVHLSEVCKWYTTLLFDLLINEKFIFSFLFQMPWNMKLLVQRTSLEIPIEFTCNYWGPYRETIKQIVAQGLSVENWLASILFHFIYTTAVQLKSYFTQYWQNYIMFLLPLSSIYFSEFP